MGREIRKVIPNWEHPQKEYPDYRSGTMRLDYQPLYDRSYSEAAAEWRKEFAEWESGERAAHFAESGEDYEYWDWNGNPPDKDYYRPEWKPEDMTWFQVYETVSEGTPVTPAFATKAELVDYLVEHGDYWDQRRGDCGWSRQNAESFVGCGYAMSMTVRTSPEGVEIKMPRDGQF